jgi:hypothetical protein
MRALIAILVVAALATSAHADVDVEPSIWLGAGPGDYRLATTFRLTLGYRHQFDDEAVLRIGAGYAVSALSRLDGSDDLWLSGLLAEASLDWPISASWRLGPWLGVSFDPAEPAAAGIRVRRADLFLGADVATGFPGTGTRLELGVGAAPRSGHVLVAAVICAGVAAIIGFSLYVVAPHGH